MKKHFIPYLVIILIYSVLSFILLFSDMKEPDRLTFDISFPKLDEDEPDKTYDEIESLVTYTLPIDNTNIITQTIYTPKIITGIDIWMRHIESGSSGIYTVSFYNPDGSLAYSQDFSTEKVSKDGYTTILFDDFNLDEGKQFNMTITPKEGSSNIIIGMVYDNSSWAGGLYDNAGLIKNTIFCFNLIYDYQNFGFLNWMVLTLICMFLLIYTTKKFFSQDMQTKGKIYFAAIITLLIIIVMYVAFYSKMIL